MGVVIALLVLFQDNVLIYTSSLPCHMLLQDPVETVPMYTHTVVVLIIRCSEMYM